jgi:hypothetical protein
MRGTPPLLLLRASLALVIACVLIAECSGAMTTLELSELRDSTVQLFKHAFGSYMVHAFPKDELRPLSCQGVDSFGGVSVTLIDSLDTLAVMGLREEFAEAVEVGVGLFIATALRRRPDLLSPAPTGRSQHRRHSECQHQVRRSIALSCQSVSS